MAEIAPCQPRICAIIIAPLFCPGRATQLKSCSFMFIKLFQILDAVLYKRYELFLDLESVPGTEPGYLYPHRGTKLRYGFGPFFK